MGFCKCGPNNLDIGEECKECGYVIPSREYERAHFWTALLISIGLGVIAFFFFALPLVEFLISLSNNSWSDGGVLTAKISAAILCGAFSLKGLDLMGPYHDGIAIWEEPEPDNGPPKVL